MRLPFSGMVREIAPLFRLLAVWALLGKVRRKRRFSSTNGGVFFGLAKPGAITVSVSAADA